METKINEEYQKLIDIIREVRDIIKPAPTVNTKLMEVEQALRNLGPRPMLNSNTQQFMDITNNMAKTYVAKNHDYGNSFEQSLDKFGLIASIVRIGDKMNRLETLVNKKAQVKDESIKDTLLDLANYSIMTVMWLNKNSNDEK